MKTIRGQAVREAPLIHLSQCVLHWPPILNDMLRLLHSLFRQSETLEFLRVDLTVRAHLHLVRRLRNRRKTGSESICGITKCDTSSQSSHCSTPKPAGSWHSLRYLTPSSVIGIQTSAPTNLNIPYRGSMRGPVSWIG